MSAINQMLRALDQRGALQPGRSSPAHDARMGPATVPMAASAGAFAAARMARPHARLGRGLLMAGGVAALLPIAWAATRLDAPDLLKPVPGPSTVAVAASPNDMVRTATVIQPAALRPPPPQAAEPALPPTAASAWPDSTSPLPAAIDAAVPTPAPERDRSDADRAEPAQAKPTPTVVAQAQPRAARSESRIALAALTPARVAPELSAAPEPTPPAPARPPRAKAIADEVAPVSAAQDTRLARASLSAPPAETRIERNPTQAKDDLTRAGEAMAIGRVSDALALLRKVIRAEPENERAHLALLSLLGERGRDDLWRQALTESAIALPQRFGLAAAQGMAESGRFDQSLEVLQRLPAAARDTRYFAALGATHQQLDHHREAVAAFDAALKLAPSSAPQLPSLLVAQALSMQAVGREADARRNLERVRQMPDAAADVREFASRELAHRR